jgi:hypothetical protein
MPDPARALDSNYPFHLGVKAFTNKVHGIYLWYVGALRPAYRMTLVFFYLALPN